MIESVTLNNFRQHTRLVVNFVEGLNVIRAPSEGGKTTILESIGYAMWGSKALRGTLAEAVTYDQPEASLKVILVMLVDGVRYTVTRGKTGAEILYAGGSVTGQTETRSFMEKLLQCSADVASKLLFADQNAVRGILSEGPTATDGLVNTLSELNTIEDLIDKIQGQLSGGNTGTIEAQIKLLQEQTLDKPELPSESEVEAANAEFLSAQAKTGLSEQAQRSADEVANAVGAVSAANAAQADLARQAARKAQIVSLLAVTVTAPVTSQAKLDEARAAQANDAEEARKRKAYATKFPICTVEWDESQAAFDAAVIANLEFISLNIVKVAELDREIHTATILKINEDSCAFCKKDLSDVPEVALRNAQSDERIQTAQASLVATKLALVDARTEKAAYDQIMTASLQIRNLAGEYWELSADVPPKPTWKGEPPVAEGVKLDIPAAEKALRIYAAEMTKQEVMVAEQNAMLVITVPDVTAAKALIEDAIVLKQNLQLAKTEQALAERKLSEAKLRLEAKVAAYEQSLKRAVEQVMEVAKLKVALVNMIKHNDLVKKLRVVRPQLAAQLWGSVLGATSQYFSMIRGQSSVVTRDVGGFRVDGRSTTGLSGSTLDALGLAIRMSLSKLFLPNVALLVLDESFSGADDNRELAGIGTIASAGFNQVLFVTHSEHPESVADNLITL